jgi:hypothetical protein
MTPNVLCDISSQKWEQKSDAALRALLTAVWISTARVLRFATRLKKIILRGTKLQKYSNSLAPIVTFMCKNFNKS